MSSLFHSTLLLAIASHAFAGTVILTSLPDAAHPIDPIASLDGSPLSSSAEIQIGSFPGMTDDQILDAATGGFSQITAAFRPFGSPRSIGNGVNGEAGKVEISERQSLPAAANDWIGQEISVLIRKNGGDEFLVARFKGILFEADSETALESLVSLHLADAKVIVGTRYGAKNFATSPAPKAGSYASWIGNFPQLETTAKRLADADPDGDGRSNFLEYATGGNPESANESSPCQIHSEPDTGELWVRFSRVPGIGNSPIVEFSPDLVLPWQTLESTPESDPTAPAIEGLERLRIRVGVSTGPKNFFRLKAE